MPCPGCDSPRATVIERNVKDRTVARCDACGNLYDHLYFDEGIDDPVSRRVNCPECVSPNDDDRDSSSHCSGYS